MRKVTGGLIVLAFLLCALSAQAASGIDVSVPSAGEPCSNDLDCGPDELCMEEICSVPTPCTNDLACGPDELCVDDICVKGECSDDTDCPDGEVCDEASMTCFECLADTDCGEDQFCRPESNQCEDFEDCNLRIRPRKIKIRNKKGKPLNRQLPNPFVIDRIKVTGNKNFKPKKIAKDEDWDAPTGLALGNSLVGLQYEAKKRSLAILFFADTVNTEPGTYYLRFGNCRGEIKLK